MITEEQIRQWAREEIQKFVETKQDRCQHSVSGTMRDSILYCDGCDKVLTWEDAKNAAPPDPVPGSLEKQSMEKALGRDV
ncbi:hypothetical protein LCGC14_1360670 [marine sediment metagenome]|uniref:Uncharacterized protein n=1 Tax=marine sediment metagenome TaxID=412755 RepID=A0A0F9K8A8_9ZZZZ